MRTKTIIEQEDFDAIEENMTTERAIEVLSEIDEGWFPYYNRKDDTDLMFYEYHCAIDLAIETLKKAKMAELKGGE